MSEEVTPFEAEVDVYNGVRIKMESLPDASQKFEFLSRMEDSLRHWTAANRRGVWLSIPIEKSGLIEPAVKLGFVFHHAEPTYIMLTHWLPAGPKTLPPNASHTIGVGMVVWNSKRELLMVCEKSGPAARRGVKWWKYPTGTVEQGEELCEAAIREVKEETGIDTEFMGLLAFRHMHNHLFGKGDLFFVIQLKPVTESIVIQESEIADCRWVPYEEFRMMKHVPEGSMYHRVNELAMAAIDSPKDCLLTMERLPVHFRPGDETLYMAPKHAATAVAAAAAAAAASRPLSPGKL